ncbi:MAG: DNA-methyltransferase [Candidatus Heimdallarchaeaceae archaeon]
MEINKIYQGDCLELMKEIEDKSIDLILTDPPYGIGYDEWDILNTSFLKGCKRILKPNGQVFVFCGWSNVISVLKRGKDFFILKDWIIYDRQKGRGTKKSLVSTREDILWFINSEEYTFNKDKAYSTIVKKTKGMGEKNKRKTRALTNVWTDVPPIVPWAKERTKHPTQKPEFLFKRILEVFSNEGDIVLDPFIGSGTTAVACKQLGRNFIGFEINKDYVKIANKRLKQQTLFENDKTE